MSAKENDKTNGEPEYERPAAKLKDPFTDQDEEAAQSKAEEKRYRSHQLSTNRHLVIVTATTAFIAAAVGIWQGCLTRDAIATAARQASAAEDANCLARRSFQANEKRSNSAMEASNAQSKAALDATIYAARLDQRAWVGPTKIDLQPMHAPDPITIIVTLTNSGKTPALRVNVTYTAHPAEVPLDISEYAKHPIERALGGPVPLTIFPNTPIQLPAKTGSTDALGIESVGNGRKLLYVFGQISYFDIFATRNTLPGFVLVTIQESKVSRACGSYDYAD